MADRSLAFDPDKCDVEAVERIPPCEVLITDATVPDAPPPLNDCLAPLIEIPPPDFACPDFTPAYPHTKALDSNFNSDNTVEYGIFSAITTSCTFHFNFALNLAPEISAVLIIGSEPVNERWLGVRMIERGLPDTWLGAEPVWVYNIRGFDLIFGNFYRVRWNPNSDRFQGARQGWTDDCCDDIVPQVCCEDQPYYFCLTFSAPGCPDLDGKQVQFSGGQGALTLWGNRYVIRLVCTNPLAGLSGYQLVVFKFNVDPDDPNVDCELIFDSVTITVCNGSTFTGTVSGHIAGTGETGGTSRGDGSCTCGGLTFTGTIAYGFCNAIDCTEFAPCTHAELGDTLCAALREVTYDASCTIATIGDVVDRTTLTWNGTEWTGCFGRYCACGPIGMSVLPDCCQATSGPWDNRPCGMSGGVVSLAPDFLAIFGFSSTACFYLPPCANGPCYGLFVEVTLPPCTDSDANCNNFTQCVIVGCPRPQGIGEPTTSIPLRFPGFLSVVSGDCAGLNGLEVMMYYQRGIGLDGGLWVGTFTFGGATFQVWFMCTVDEISGTFDRIWVLAGLGGPGFCQVGGQTDPDSFSVTMNGTQVTLSLSDWDLSGCGVNCVVDFNATFDQADCDAFYLAYFCRPDGNFP